MEKNERCLTVVDALVAGLVVLLASLSRVQGDVGASAYMHGVWAMMAVYACVRLLFSLMPKVCQYLLLAGIALLCVKETCMGFMQLLGLMQSNHYLYAVTGSFNNPGPYGGLLAVCICVLGAYALRCRNKILCYVTGGVTLLALIMLPSTMSRAAMLAVACSALLFVLSTDKGKAFVRKNWAWVTLLGLLCGVGAYALKKPSADGRLFMDRISLQAIRHNGLFGAGLGRFGGAYGDAQYYYFKGKIADNGNFDIDWTVLKDSDRLTADCPEYAFNEYLQLGVEAGPFAMLLFLAIVVTAIIASYRKGTAWCYGLLALAVFAFFSYPLRTLQFRLMLAALLAASVTPCKRSGVIGVVVWILASGVILVELMDNSRGLKGKADAETEWKKTEHWYNMEYYDYVANDGCLLYDALQYDYKFLFAYGQSLNKTGDYAKSDSVLLKGAAISADPMFWNVMGNNSLAQGNYREAEERYKHAFCLVPNRLYPLYLLAKMYYQEGDAQRFLEMAAMVETFVPKVESVNTERLRSEILALRAEWAEASVPQP